MLRPSRLACTECRKHHIKCDAKKPSCTRCLETRLACNYLPSRRGGRRKTRDSSRPDLGTSPALPCDTDHPPPVSRFHDESGVAGPANVDVSNAEGNSLPPADDANSDSVPDARLVRLYYENFHLAHPILLPASLYEERNYPPFLHQVVKFIGSHYSVLDLGDSRDATALQLSSSGERTPCMVQALLLYAIFLRARSQCAEAQAAFSQAIDIALELKMYRKDFAITFSNGSDAEAESLRRTWWELYITEVYMIALQQKVILRCGSVPLEVPLPCEESVYIAHNNIPEPSTLARFKMRVFDEDEGDANSCQYSSFSYRIEAISILARVLVLNSLPETNHDHLQAVANALVSWTNHLPPHKVDVVDTYGHVDEMLFQAHTTIHYAAILLHLPRSNLQPGLPDTDCTICPVTPARLSPSFTRHVHDIKATEASKQLSNLLTVRPSVHGYSPFIVFSLVLCGMVQLATSRCHSFDCSDHHCNRVILVLGCLNMLKRHWPVAQKAHRYLRRVAAETFTAWMESEYSQASSRPETSKSNTSKDFPADDSACFGTDLGIDHGLFSPRILSAYIDPTCSDPMLLNTMSECYFA